MHSTLDQCLWTLSLLIRSSIPDFILKKYYSDVKQISPSFIGSSKTSCTSEVTSAGITWLPPKFYECLGPEEPSPRPSLPSPNTWVPSNHRRNGDTLIDPSILYQAPCPGTMPGWQPPPKAKVLHLASSQKTIAQHLRRNRGMRWGDDTFYTLQKN